MAAHTPESGIGTTTSASTPALARQPATELGPNLVHALAEHVAVGARKVDVLEDALRLRRRSEWLDRLDPRRTQHNELARLDVPDVLRADQIQCAGLRAQHPRVAELAEGERPEPVRIANAEYAVRASSSRMRTRRAPARSRRR